MRLERRFQNISLRKTFTKTKTVVLWTGFARPSSAAMKTDALKGERENITESNLECSISYRKNNNMAVPVILDADERLPRETERGRAGSPAANSTKIQKRRFESSQLHLFFFFEWTSKKEKSTSEGWRWKRRTQWLVIVLYESYLHGKNTQTTDLQPWNLIGSLQATIDNQLR